MVDVLEAIGEVRRRRIVELLGARELPAGEIAGHFEVSRPAVSQHLRVLVEARVLKVRRDGRQRLYSVEPLALAEVGDWLEAQHRRWADALDDLERVMETGEA